MKRYLTRIGVGTAIVLIFFFLFYAGLFSKAHWSASVGATCSAYSPDEVRLCNLTTDWSAPVAMDPATKPGVYHRCFVHPLGTYIDQKPAENNAIQYRAEFLIDGQPVPMTYRAKQGADTGDCPRDNPRLLYW